MKLDHVGRWAPVLLSILRIVAAFLFLQHGAQKLFGYPERQGPAIELFSRIGIAGALEFFGGLMLLAGLLTRPVAFVLSGLMAFAYFIAHAPQGFWPVLNRGELAALYCFLFLYLAAAGAGPLEPGRAARAGGTPGIEHLRRGVPGRMRHVPPREFS